MGDGRREGGLRRDGNGRAIEGYKKLYFTFFAPVCRCTRLSHLYPFVAVSDCRTTCTRLSLYPTVAYPCTRLSLYPTVANFCTRLSLYPTVASVPVCHCTQLSLYPTVAVPNCPRTRLSGTGAFSPIRCLLSEVFRMAQLESLKPFMDKPSRLLRPKSPLPPITF